MSRDIPFLPSRGEWESKASVMPDLTERTCRMMGVDGVSGADIHDMLISAGLTETQAFYTYQAAKIIMQGRQAL